MKVNNNMSSNSGNEKKTVNGASEINLREVKEKISAKPFRKKPVRVNKNVTKQELSEVAVNIEAIKPVKTEKKVNPLNRGNFGNRPNRKPDIPGLTATDSRVQSKSKTNGKSTVKETVKIIPLGGIDEIGKNMTAIEYKDEIIVIDCGLKFPEDEMLGVDIVIPDVNFLLKNKEKVKGFFITHGHEDHIGALPYILKQINIPVYATRLTLGLIEIKLREHKLFDIVKLNTVKPRDVIKLGGMEVEFIKTNHSIADAAAIAIHTPVGTIVHTGDFKVDLTPVDGDVIDLARFAQLGEQGVLVLMADSTNVERPGYTYSESTIGQNFERIFLGAKGRILVATFSSNIHRLQQIAQAAIKLGRKCVFSGRSMENVVAVARELGYLNIEDKHIISIDEVSRFRDDQLCIMTTGSQGEPMSALTRMAMGEHRKITIKPGDMVILSSHPIPGNEKLVSKIVNQLFK
ncbi:MAG: ribonuclease J, partial [Clostridiaceae bacterium]